MILIPKLETLTLEQLNANFCALCKKNRAASGSSKVVIEFTLDLYAKEFERRADLIPTAILMDLINSGLTFSFKQKFLQ